MNCTNVVMIVGMSCLRSWHVNSTTLILFFKNIEFKKNVTHTHQTDASTLESDEGRGQLRYAWVSR